MTQHDEKINRFVNSAMSRIVSGMAIEEAIEEARKVHQEKMDTRQLAEAARKVKRAASDPKTVEKYRLALG